jgi:hypothetical protein
MLEKVVLDVFWYIASRLSRGIPRNGGICWLLFLGCMSRLNARVFLSRLWNIRNSSDFHT